MVIYPHGVAAALLLLLQGTWGYNGSMDRRSLFRNVAALTASCAAAPCVTNALALHVQGDTEQRLVSSSPQQSISVEEKIPETILVDNSDHQEISSPLNVLWDEYNSLLDAHPLYTKMATSLVGFTIGDVLAQTFLEDEKEYDFMRTLRLGSFGLLLHGSLGHYFYGYLDSNIPGTDATAVATKVLIDQSMANPIFGCIFFGYLNFAEGKSWTDYVEKMRADWKTTVTGSWSVWIPAHVVNFAFVPPSQRLLYINTIQIGYNVFLSLIGNKQVEQELE